MALAASVVNGEVVTSTTATTNSGTIAKENTTSNSSLDKDAFLQLLVAQMKYQDPLEPTSNTEYISQFATFSELEEMQNLSSSMDTQRASSLVGQYVTVKSTGTTGETTLIGGKVDYVSIENGKAYLNINGNKYSIDELDSVVDQEYLNAYTLATDFAQSFAKLPALGNLTTGYQEVIENLRKVYDNMSDYQKGFISSDMLNSFAQYEAKMAELLKTTEA